MAAETVDTRVVEAKFDSKQFEQGVDKTVKKLDELKKSLNLKDGEKSVAQIGDKISQTSEKASESLEKLEQRFTSFFGMLKNKLVGAVADEIVGGIFKIKNSIAGLVSSLSTGQIGYGMQRYTDMLGSVRTLVSAGVNQDAAYETIERLGEYADQTSYSLDQLVSTMSKLKTAGASLSTAQRMVEGLSNAAASMGVNAQDAARAYLNLQQAYSKGKLTQEDWISFESLPMVGEKFNQAIIDAAVKVGTLKKDKDGTYRVDTKGIKASGGTAGRATGAAMKGITAENMGTKLAPGWATKKVMEEFLGTTYYFAEIDVDEFNKLKKAERDLKREIGEVDKATGKVKDQAWFEEEFQKVLDAHAQERRAAYVDELTESLEKGAITQEEYTKALEEFDKSNVMTVFSYDCLRAGQEARSFTDVMNTLKDVVSRGWAKSFELIFGQLDEAADFFTQLTESQFAEGIYAIGEFRNLVLEGWRNAGGRDDMLGVLGQIDDLFGSIYKKIGLIEDTAEERFNNMFDQEIYMGLMRTDGEEAAEAYKQNVKEAADISPFETMAKEMGQRLEILTRNVGDFFEKVKKWFTEADTTGTPRIQRIANLLNGVGTIFKGILKGAGIALEQFGNIYLTIKPIFDQLWKVIEEVLTPVFNLFNPEVKNKNGIDLYTTLTGALEKLNAVVTSIVDPLNTVINLVGGIFRNVIWNNLEKAFKPVLDMLNPPEGYTGINIYQTLADGLENLNTVVQKIAGPIETVFGTIGDVLGEVLPFLVSMGIDTALMNIQFFADVFAGILELLGLGSAQQKRNEGVIDGIKNGIKELGQACKDAIGAVSGFFASLFDDLKKLLGIGTDPGSAGDGNIFSGITEWFNTNEFVQNIKARIEKAFTDIGDFIKDLPNRLTNIGITIGDFFKSIFYEKRVSSIANTGKTTTTWVKRSFVTWIETNILNPVKEFIANFPDNVTQIAIDIGDFFKSIFYTKVTSSVANTGKTTTTWIKKPLTAWFTNNIITPIQSFIDDFPNQAKSIGITIGDFFKSIFYTKVTSSVANTGKTTTTWVKKPFTSWLTNNIINPIKNFFKDFPNNAKNLVVNLGDIFKSIFYTKVTSSVANTGTTTTTWIKKPFTQWFTTNLIHPLSNFVQNLPETIGQAIGTVGNFVGKVVSAIFGKEDGSDATSDDVTEGIRKPFLGVNVTGIVNSIKGIGKRILNGVASIFTGSDDWDANKNWIADGVASFITKIEEKGKDAWDTVSGWITKIPDFVASLFSDDNTKAATGDDSKIGSAILSFAGSVGNWITQIPDRLLTAWEGVEKQSSSIWNKIIEWVTGDSSADRLTAANQRTYNSIFKTEGKEEAEAFKQVALQWQWEEDNPIVSNIQKFFVHLGDHLKEKVEGFPETVSNIWNGLMDWVHGIVDKIAGWFEEDATDTGSKDGKIPTWISTFVTNIGNWVKGIPSDLLSLWEQAVKISGSLWDKIVSWVTGDSSADQLTSDNQKRYNSILKTEGKEEAEVFKQLALQWQWEKENPIAAAIQKFFVNVGDFLKSTVENFPQTVSNAWNDLMEWVHGIVDDIAKWFEDDADGADPSKKDGKIQSWISTFINNVGAWISKIPSDLLSLWEQAEKISGSFWNKIVSWITGDSDGGQLNSDNQKRYNSILKTEGKEEAEVFKQLALQWQWKEENPIAANIRDFFKHLLTFMGEKIAAIPGAIKNGWDVAVDVCSAIIHVIFGIVDEKKQEESPIYNAVVDIFDSVKNWVIEKGTEIGDKIKEGWNKAVTIGGIIKDVLFGGKRVFSQKEYDAILNAEGLANAERKAEAAFYKNSTINYGNETYNSIGAFFETVKDWIRKKIEELPEAIANGWKAFKDLGSKVGPKILEGLQSALTWVTEKIGKVTSKLNEAHGQGKSILEVIKEKLTSTDKNGSEEDETEHSLWSIIQGIGATLKTLITDTIPKFISSAFEEIKKDIPKLISKIFGGGKEEAVAENMASEILKYENADPTGYAAKQYERSITKNAKKNKSVWDTIMDLLLPSAGAEEALEDAKDKKDKEEKEEAETLSDKIREKLGGFSGIIEIVKNIGNIAGSFLSSDIGKYLLLGLVISSILSTISDILSMTDEMNAAKDLAKWESIKFAVLGIIAILGYVSYLAAQSDKTQLNDTLDALNRLADVLQKMMIPIGIIMGLSTLKSFFDWRTSKAEGDEISGFGETLISKVSDVFLGPLEGLTTTVGAGLSAGFLGQIGELLAGNMEGIFSQLGSGMEALSGYLVDTINNIDKITGRVQQAITTVNEVKDLIKAFIDLMWFEPEIDQDTDHANAIKNLIEAGRNGGWLPPEEANKLATSEEKHSVEITTALGKVTKAFGKMSGALTLFKNAVSGYGDDAEQVAKAIGDLTSMSENMKKFGEFSETKDFEIFKKAFTSLGAIFRLYSDSMVDDFSETPKELNISNAVDLIRQLFGSEDFKSLIQEFSKDETLPDLNDKTLEKAERIIIFAGALSSIAKACSELKGDEDEAINKLIDIVSKVNAPVDAGKDIDDIAIQFGQLGNALGSFASETSEINDKNVKTAGEALDMLLRIAVGLQEIPNNTFLAELFTGQKSLGHFGLEIETLGTHLKAFFESLENLGSMGQSRDFNRKNISLALMAIQGIAEGVYIISRAPYLDAFKKNLEGGLTDFFGDLGSLATSIMTFITTIDDYTIPGDGIINFDFVYNTIDSIGKIWDNIKDIPNTYNNTTYKIGDRIDTLCKILFGAEGSNGYGGHSGILQTLSDFLQRTVLATKNGEYTVSLSDAASLISSYADTIEQVVTLVMRLGKINYEDLSADIPNTSGTSASYTSPIELIIPSLTNINDNFNVIKTFIDNAATLNETGVNNALDFFTGLNNLGDALFIFSQKDNATGKYNVMDGLNKLLEFNWESLRTVIDDMRASLGEDEDFYNPKITPVLNITDEFTENSEKLRKMLGITTDADGNWTFAVQPEMSLNSTIDLSALDGISTKLDKLDEINKTVDQLKTIAGQFNSALASARFALNINGQHFAEVIGPDISTWLGAQEMNSGRTDLTHGGWTGYTDRV